MFAATANRIEAATATAAESTQRAADAATDWTPAGPTSIRNFDGLVLPQYRAPKNVTWGDVFAASREISADLRVLARTDRRRTVIHSLVERGYRHLAAADRASDWQTRTAFHTPERAWLYAMSAAACANYAYSL